MRRVRVAVVSCLFVGAIAMSAVPALCVGAGLPTPFERLGELDLLGLLYPGDVAPPKLKQTAIWKGEGTPRLLALVDRTDDHYEFAEFALEQGQLVLVARYKEPRAWDDCY